MKWLRWSTVQVCVNATVKYTPVLKQISWYLKNKQPQIPVVLNRIAIVKMSLHNTSCKRKTGRKIDFLISGCWVIWNKTIETVKYTICLLSCHDFMVFLSNSWLFFFNASLSIIFFFYIYLISPVVLTFSYSTWKHTTETCLSVQEMKTSYTAISVTTSGMIVTLVIPDSYQTLRRTWHCWAELKRSVAFPRSHSLFQLLPTTW